MICNLHTTNLLKHLFFTKIDFSIVFDFYWLEYASDMFLYSGRFRPSIDCKGEAKTKFYFTVIEIITTTYKRAQIYKLIQKSKKKLFEFFCQS